MRRAAGWSFPNVEPTGGYVAETPAGLPTASPAVARCTASWPRRLRRSWPCSSSGARSTARTGSWPTAGSYLGRFWCSPSTVRRVLLLGDKQVRPAPRPGRSAKSAFPDWAALRPNSIWIYDSTHFTRCGMTVLIIEDLVSRKWLTHLVSVEETHTQVQNAFIAALEAEGLLDAALERAGTGRVDPDADDGLSPILLAVSDIHTECVGIGVAPRDSDRSAKFGDSLPVESGGTPIPHWRKHALLRTR